MEHVDPLVLGMRLSILTIVDAAANVAGVESSSLFGPRDLARTSTRGPGSPVIAITPSDPAGLGTTRTGRSLTS